MAEGRLKKKARTRIIIGDATTNTDSFVTEKTIKLESGVKRGGKAYEMGEGRKKQRRSTVGGITSGMAGSPSRRRK